MKKGLDNKRSKHWLIKLLVLLGVVVGFFAFKKKVSSRSQPAKISRKNEKRKIHHSLIEYFIPHERNEYRPKVFHASSVTHLILVVVLVKVTVVSLLIMFYPNVAQLNRDIQTKMYRMINEYRADVGVKALTADPYLEQTALAKGQDMLDKNYFSHYGMDGKKPWQWIDTQQYNFLAMGENLAMDFLTADSVFQAFQNSPTHDKNLINTAYDDIGISILNGYLDGHNTNVMVVFFASPKVRAATTVAVATPEPPLPQVVVNEVVQADEVVEKPEPEPEDLEPKTEELEVEPPQFVEEVVDTLPRDPEFTVRQLAAADTNLEVLGEAVTDTSIVSGTNLSGGVVFSQGSILQRVIAWADRFLMMLLVVVGILLAINIFVKIRIQHVPAIVNATLLIIVATIALRFNIHQAEAIGEKVRILSSMFL